MKVAVFKVLITQLIVVVIGHLNGIKVANKAGEQVFGKVICSSNANLY